MSDESTEQTVEIGGPGLPADGTRCEFTYGGQVSRGIIENRLLVVEGNNSPFGTFSKASRTISKTSRNGWNDWYLDFGDGQKNLRGQLAKVLVFKS